MGTRSLAHCCCCCALWALFWTSQVLAGERPPNVIVVLADDLGAGELGCYGSGANRTPHLDRLAAEGMRFETCYATPLCTPSRVALMTGRYGFRTGYFNMLHRPLSPRLGSLEYEIADKLTFADVLKSRGYATAIAGKWQLPGRLPDLVRDCGFDRYRIWDDTFNVPPDFPRGAGTDDQGKPSRYWHPCILENGEHLPTRPDDYGPDLFIDFAIDFARKNRARPFLVYLTMPLVHDPIVETPDPARPGVRLPASLPANIEYLDHLMGRLVAGIDELGLAKNTLLLFLGDNGSAGAGKGTLTERGVRVPLIVRCPGTVRAGVVSRELTDVTDILPTLAEFAGAELPDGYAIDGVNLARTLRGETGRHREWIFSFLGPGRMLRDDRWLLELPGDGTERFYDCGASRDGSGYQLVERATAGDAGLARRRFAELLENLPGPQGHANLIPDDGRMAAWNKEARKRAKRWWSWPAPVAAAAIAGMLAIVGIRLAARRWRRRTAPRP